MSKFFSPFLKSRRKSISLLLRILVFLAKEPNTLIFSIPKDLGYGIGIPLAVATFILAVVRYKQRKDRGE